METLSAHKPDLVVIQDTKPVPAVLPSTQAETTMDPLNGQLSTAPRVISVGYPLTSFIAENFDDLYGTMPLITAPTKPKKNRDDLSRSRKSRDILSAVEGWVTEANLDRGLPQTSQLANAFGCSPNLMRQVIYVLKQEGKIPDPAPMTKPTQERVVFQENSRGTYVQLAMPLPFERKKPEYSQLPLVRRPNLTETIANRIRPEILKLEVDEKIPTGNQIAQAKGCSPSTAGKVLQFLADERLISLHDDNRSEGYYRTDVKPDTVLPEVKIFDRRNPKAPQTIAALAILLKQADPSGNHSHEAVLARLKKLNGEGRIPPTLAHLLRE